MPPVNPELFEFEFDPNSIRLVRGKLDLSQSTFATRLDLPVNTISRWETGATTPDASSLAAIWSIAIQNRIEPRFFKSRSEIDASSRSCLTMLWESPLGSFDWTAIEEHWRECREYFVTRFGNRRLSIDGVLYDDVGQSPFDFRYAERLGLPQDSIEDIPRIRHRRFAEARLRIERIEHLSMPTKLENDAAALVDSAPSHKIVVIATDDRHLVSLVERLRESGIEAFAMPASDDCPEGLLESTSKAHAIHFKEPFIVNTTVQLIDELNGDEVSRSGFGNLLKEKLDECEVDPKNAGFRGPNPYGSILRWLERQGVVKAGSVQGNKVKIRRLR